MNKSAADCLVLFDTGVKGRLAEGWASGVLLQRVKTVKAGPMLDVECYPIWDTKTATAAKTEAEQERHRKAQAKLNKKNAEKKLKWLLDENFGPCDISITLKYHDHCQPESEKTALKDVQNYIRRIKRLRKKRKLPEIRYVYVIEETNGARGRRFHCHLVMSGDGIEAGEAICKWTEHVKGYTYMGQVRPGTNERSTFLEALAKYMLDDTKAERDPQKDGKNPQKRAMKRMWNCSKNLRNPADYATTADKKISIRKAQKIAETMDDGVTAELIFEKLYPGYALVLDDKGKPVIDVKRSRWTSGVYITAQLRKKERKNDGKNRIDSEGRAGRTAGKRGTGTAVRVGGTAKGCVP
ncbi:MAG: hypothetical protein IJ313_10480 [Clostridia bacterium]|nr:hypothetical protein [Clostridia bacterium]